MKVFLSKVAIFLLVVYVLSWVMVYFLDHNVHANAKLRWAITQKKPSISSFIIGPSLAESGINTCQLDSNGNPYVFNIGIPQFSVSDCDMLVRVLLACHNNSPSTKVIIVISPGMLLKGDNLSDRKIHTFYFIPYRQSIDYNSIKINSATKIVWKYMPILYYAYYNKLFYINGNENFTTFNRCNGYLPNYDTLSNLPNELLLKLDTLKSNPKQLSIDIEQVGSFVSMIEFLKNKHVSTIVIDVPSCPQLRDALDNIKTYNQAKEIISTVCKENSISYIPASRLYDQLTATDYSNAFHLNDNGAFKVRETLYSEFPQLDNFK